MFSPNVSRLFTSFAAVALLSLSGTRALALDPAKAPGQNFDLSNFSMQAWPCSGGSDLVVSQPQLATYQNTQCFYTGSDGSMVMWCPDQGGCTTGTNTAHQRTELRDLSEYPATDTQLHVETATCVVLQLPKSGSTIIGQIHGDDPVTGAEALKLRCMVAGTLPDGTSVAQGTLLAGNKTTVGGTENYSHFVPEAIAKIGDEIDYTIQWQNLKVTVTVVINKDSGHTYSYTLSGGSTWAQFPLYFKAGNYNQDDVDGTTDGALVAFYALDGPIQSQVAAPSFSPGGGTYTSAQNVTISSATSGASIRYTTDGSTPSETAGTIYSGAVNISSTKTLKAIAYESGDTDSSVASATYTITVPVVATPTFSPVGGTYSGAQTVLINDSTSGASIRYTTDGSTPSETNGTVYSVSISIGSTTTLKAIAYESGSADSSVASTTYTITVPVVATPTFSPVAGTYSNAQNVTVSSATSGASIRYTLDGSTPSETVGTIYSGPVNISSTVTLKAIAYKSGDTDSSIASAAYTINNGSTTVSVSTGFFNTAMSSSQAGTFTATFDASPSLSPSNTTMALCKGTQTAYTGLSCIARFNTSGDIDAYNGTAYQAASTIPYSAGATYHFRMVVNVPANTYSIFVTPPGGSELTVGSNYGFRAAATSLDTWNIDVNATPGGSVTVSNLSVVGTQQAAAPSFSPAGGTYSGAQTVTISDSTSGASIRYTTDGSTPSETAGTLYSGSISIAATTTLKAIAYKSGDTDSSIASATYTIGGGSCVTATSGGTWQNTALTTSETGTFTATFDATPSASPTNAVVGLSKGAQTAYTGFGCIARFNTSGDIDAYNNTGYVSTTIPYSAGVTYHFRMVVNVSAHTYSVYVTPAGGTELTVGLNYAFRSTQNTVTSLDHWGAFVDVAGSGGNGTLNVCNFAVQ
jgi:hypothetical protein